MSPSDIAPAKTAEPYTWRNKPRNWSFDGELDQLLFEVEPGTDMWLKVDEGKERASAHFLCLNTDDFRTASANVAMEGMAESDHLGVMVARNTREWIKACVENIDGVRQASVVQTDGESQLILLGRLSGSEVSKISLNRVADRLKISIQQGLIHRELELDYALDSSLPTAVGLMAASPKGVGFAANVGCLRVNSIAPSQERR